LLILIVVAVIILLVYTNIPSLIMNWDPEQVLALANDNIPLLLLITFLLMLVQNMLSFFPLLLLFTINISLFGLFYGYLWSFFSSVVGNVVAFLIVRNGLQGFLIKKINQNLINKIENNGFYFVFMMRIFPLLPTSIINVAVGMSTVKLKGFLYGTIFGNMIYLFVLALIPMGLMSEDSDIYLYVIIGVLLLIGLVMWRKHAKKKKHDQGV
jgi:uncharacterized membrane protein YdjX (TVP38/TMEM64 family)